MERGAGEDLQVNRVCEALLKIFGPDHVPNPRDFARVARPGPVTKNQEVCMYVDYYEDFVEDIDLQDDGHGYWEQGEGTQDTTSMRPTKTMCRRT